MSVWATQRKLTYISILIVFILVVIAYPAYHFLYRPPTCSDGKQDQGEQGVDCGGPCKLLCPAQALAPIVHWERVFPVSPGSYNALAYVENPNLGSYAENVPYKFDVYDQNGTLLVERKGTVNIWANTKFAIFEPNISTGSRTAASVTFEFTSQPVWIKDNLNFPQIVVTNPLLSETDTSPHLNATIENDSFTPVQDLPVVAIVYDSNGNALDASQTVVSYLAKGTPQNIFFVWPTPFVSPAAQEEIIPLVSPLDLPADVPQSSQSQ